MVSQRYVITVERDDMGVDVYGPMNAQDAKRTLDAWLRREPTLAAYVQPLLRPVFRDVIVNRWAS